MSTADLFDGWRRRTHRSAAGAEAIEALATSGLPDRRREGWRWSDLSVAVALIGPKGALPPDPFADIAAMDVQDGDAADDTENAPEWRDDLVPLAGAIAALADRRIRVAIASDPGAPLRLPSGDGNDRFDHTEIVVGAGVRARMIETRVSSGGFFGSTTTIHVGEGAHLERVIYRAGTPQALHLALEDIRLEAGAELTQTTVTAGAGYSRADVTVTMLGQDASARMDSLYVLGDKRHADLTTLVDHRAPGCTTRQTTRGVVGGGGRGVFQGKFHVARAAQKTDAHMHHGAVLLTPNSWAFARPELEIYADDVGCAHGNAIGAMDPQTILYARQRGLPESEARALLARGFAAEALDALTVGDPLRSRLQQTTDQWIAHSC